MNGNHHPADRALPNTKPPWFFEQVVLVNSSPLGQT